MHIWTEMARASNSAGDNIVLCRRREHFEIRFNDAELMASSCHQSEDVLAEKALRYLGRPARRVLIGGLGLGYTLRMALNYLDDEAEVIVSELVPEIVQWNRQYFSHLADNPLNDPRVEVRIEDVQETLDREFGSCDIVLMDTDNGPDQLVRTENGRLYEEWGLKAVSRALVADGIAGFWSSERSRMFEMRLSSMHWDWRCDSIALPGGRIDAFHYLYLASRNAATFRSPRIVGADPAPG